MRDPSALRAAPAAAGHPDDFRNLAQGMLGHASAQRHELPSFKSLPRVGCATRSHTNLLLKLRNVFRSRRSRARGTSGGRPSCGLGRPHPAIGEGEGGPSGSGPCGIARARSRARLRAA